MASGCLRITPASVCASQTSLLWYRHPMPPSSCRRLSPREMVYPPPYKYKVQGRRRRAAPSPRCSRHLDLAPVLTEGHQLNMAMKARQRPRMQKDNKSGPSAAVMVQTTSVRLRGRHRWSRVTRKVHVHE